MRNRGILWTMSPRLQIGLRRSIRHPMGRKAWGLCMLAGMALAGAPGLGQSTDAVAEQQRRLREQQYKPAQNTASTLPKFDAKTMSDVFRLRIKEGQLTCDSALLAQDNPNGGQFKIEL